jgi:2-polyprenyl-3-methyl-5-hydroxy-6-metoxy-1,4-benzoquinol methylase
METTKNCPLCGEIADLTFSSMKGYIEGTHFDIYECSHCLTSFANPLTSDELVYKYIYEQANVLRGYERYDRYSKLVRKLSDPLAILCAAESAYWSVRQALQKHFPNKNVSILEIGSGLGYFTYSLNKAGYNTVGLDLAKNAVANATKIFGEFYEEGDIFERAKDKQKKYDCVIMTELIEHVEEPEKFIAYSLSMLKDGGKLILTTPNKSVNPKGTIWATDAPPVHLWWFSEKSIAIIAQHLGRNCEFIDFTAFTKRFYEARDLPPPTMDEVQSSLPRLTKDGKVVASGIDKSLKVRLLSIEIRYVLSYIRRRLKKKIVSSRSCEICAVIS